MYYKLKQEELNNLESEFQGVGYTPKQIEEIKHHDGAFEIEDFIDNLEEEKSNWDC